MKFNNFFIVFFSLSITAPFYAVKIETMYGTTEVDEPVLLQLLECPTMQRLKAIQQYGILHYLDTNAPNYSRYEHSVGVFFLTRRAGASLIEQIAALLHDASHTLFSHVGDFLYDHYKHKSSYQDDIHTQFLEKTEIPALLAECNLTVEQINPKTNYFPALDQDIPDLCADRIEYILYGGFIDKALSKDDIDYVLNHLIFENNKWVCTDMRTAQLIGYTSLYLTENRFGTAYNCGMYYLTAQALRRALTLQLLTKHDIHYGTDEYAWNLLTNSNDHVIKKLCSQLYAGESAYRVVPSTEDYDFSFMPKFRGVDPLIKSGDNLTRLTNADEGYRQQYDRVQQLMNAGIYLQFTELQN